MATDKTKTGKGPWGDAIKYWLKQQGASQNALAEATGIRTSTISELCRGLDKNTKYFRVIAETLDVDVADVLVSPEHRLAKENDERIERLIEATLARKQPRLLPKAKKRLKRAKRGRPTKKQAKAKQAKLKRSSAATKPLATSPQLAPKVSADMDRIVEHYNREDAAAARKKATASDGPRKSRKARKPKKPSSNEAA